MTCCLLLVQIPERFGASCIDIEYLRKEGFTEEVLIALDALTKRDNESYHDFISRVIEDKIAYNVKLADSNDNMDLSRISNPTQKDYERIEKYRKATERIIQAVCSEKE